MYTRLVYKECMKEDIYEMFIWNFIMPYLRNFVTLHIKNYIWNVNKELGII